MRVNPNFEPTVVAGIEQTEQSLQTADEQVATGLRVQDPSDDPAAAAALVGNQTETANVDQYTTNADTLQSLSEAGSSTLNSINTLLTQAISLGTEGANGTLTTVQQQIIASQVQSILTDVVSAANTSYAGTSLFGGTANPSQAFVADASSPTGYSYQGNTGVNTVQVGADETVQANIPGSTLFTNPDANVLGSLSELVTALQNGHITDIGNATDAVSTAQSYLTSQQVILSNTTSQVESQETYLSQETLTLSSQENTLIGIDPASAAENLANAEEQNSAALAAAAKVLPVSLLSYLQ
jgi:flagellar hook-associated protein 3 FlgL